jgi:hypothetical protein
MMPHLCPERRQGKAGLTFAVIVAVISHYCVRYDIPERASAYVAEGYDLWLARRLWSSAGELHMMTA